MKSGVFDYRKRLLTKSAASKRAQEIDGEFSRKARAVQEVANTEGWSVLLWWLEEQEKLAVDRLIAARRPTDDDMKDRAVAEVCRKFRGFLSAMETAKEVEKSGHSE